MPNTLSSRLKNAWNVFRNKDPSYPVYEYASSIRPDRPRLYGGNERTIINSIFTRISMDIASIDIFHVKTNDDGNFTDIIDSGLNNCLSIEANIDQTGRAFRQDMALELLDEGVIAVCPVDTTYDPNITGSYDINSMRVGKILEWYPEKVKVRVYNEQTGKREDVVISKKIASIIENPMYAVMNEPNSTLKRLVRKLALLDFIDEQTGSGKLNLIIQLPYTVKSPTRVNQAEKRREDLERQLTKSQYGIGYMDGTEKITQLNRPLENNLMGQIEFLTNQLFSQLGITQGILDGTADEQTMLNYYNRVIEPIVSAMVDEMKRKFLTKTARTQHQSIMFFRDPFKLIPVTQIAEMSDKLTRNEIVSSNEMRQKIGMKPSDDPRADELRNKNINQSNEELLNTKGRNVTSEMIDESGSESSSEDQAKSFINKILRKGVKIQNE